MKAATEMTEWIVGRRCPIRSFVDAQYQELREQVYRDLMSATDAAEELQTRALAEWKHRASVRPASSVRAGEDGRHSLALRL